MKATYDPQVDAMRIRFSDAAVEKIDEEKPGIILDYDKDGNVVALEVLDASKRMSDPRRFEYAETGLAAHA